MTTKCMNQVQHYPLTTKSIHQVLLSPSDVEQYVSLDQFAAFRDIRSFSNKANSGLIYNYPLIKECLSRLGPLRNFYTYITIEIPTSSCKNDKFEVNQIKHRIMKCRKWNSLMVGQFIIKNYKDQSLWNTFLSLYKQGILRPGFFAWDFDVFVSFFCPKCGTIRDRNVIEFENIQYTPPFCQECDILSLDDIVRFVLLGNGLAIFCSDCLKKILLAKEFDKREIIDVIAWFTPYGMYIYKQHRKEDYLKIAPHGIQNRFWNSQNLLSVVIYQF